MSGWDAVDFLGCTMTGASDSLCDERGHALTVSRSRNVDHETRMCDLKCAACGKIRRHAFVVQSASVQALDPLTALSSVLRLHVVEVEEPNQLAWVDDDAGVILIRPGLCDADQSRVAALALLDA